MKFIFLWKIPDGEKISNTLWSNQFFVIWDLFEDEWNSFYRIENKLVKRLKSSVNMTKCMGMINRNIK